MRVVLLVVLALVAGVGTFFLVRSQRAAGSRPAGTLYTDGASHPAGILYTDGVSHPDGGYGQRGERPALPPQGFEFDGEVRDGVWADEQERELTLRVRKIVGDLQKAGKTVDITGIECRRSLCKLTLHAPDSDTIGSMYGKLEEPTGLLGWADHILLDAVQVGDDGRVRTDVLAVFERDPTP